MKIRYWVLSVSALMFTLLSGLNADFVGPARAESMSKGWLKAANSPLGAKMNSVVDGIVEYKDSAGAPAFYVVNLSPSGFIVVPADDYVQPVVAFSSDGKFIADPQNPLYDFVTMDIPKRIENVKSKRKAALDAKIEFLPPKGMSDAKSKWDSLVGVYETGDSSKYGTTPTLDDYRVTPITQSTWNQEKVSGSNCYNYYTPNNYVCGCVATALAQLIRFNQYPTAGIGTGSHTIYVNGITQSASTRGGDGAGGAYDWTKMPLSPDAGITLEQRQMIGSLCSDAGICVEMDYTSSSSGTDTLLAGDALTGVFQYGNAIKGYNGSNELVGSGLYEMANPNLDAGLPVLLGITGSDGGHAIVCDGYGYNLSVMYHHLNMGWSGQDNTWYDLPNIGTWASFTKVYKCIYNVFKSGTGEIISGRVVDDSGAPVSGAQVGADDGAGGTFSDTTDQYGIYAFPKVKSATTYTVTCNGQTQQVTTGTSTQLSTTCGNKWAINFPVVSGSSSISGTVSGALQQGVELALSGSASNTILSRADGTYTFTGLTDGSYTVTPRISGYTFAPSNWNITISGKNVTGCDFVATKNPGQYSLSGTVSGAVQSGVTITLSGALSSTTVSGADGSYSFTGLADGSYIVTSGLSGYTFTPYSQDVTISGADQADIDFAATAISIFGSTSKLSFNASYKDSIKKIDGSYVQYSTDKFTIQTTIQFPDTFDLNTIGENTGFSFNFGYYSFSNTLGNDPKAKLNKEKGGSATFKITGDDEIKLKTMTVEKVDIKWDKKKKLTVRITGTPVSDSDNNVVDLYDKDDGDITGNIETFLLTFNSAGATFGEVVPFPLTYTGNKKTKTVIKDKGKDTEETFTLVEWSAKGKK